jgi:hypothetical protein
MRTAFKVDDFNFTDNVPFAPFSSNILSKITNLWKSCLEVLELNILAKPIRAISFIPTDQVFIQIY